MNKLDIERGQAHRSTLLIVDDQPLIIQTLSNLFRDDYNIKVATGGIKALEIAESDPQPGLILLDIRMPDVDGYEVCRRLQENDRTRGIPVIFITAMNEDADEEKGLNLGAVDFITKPIRPAIVRARVRNHMSLKIKTNMLERLSMVDSLTDMPNRRFFDDYFARAWGYAHRESKLLSIMMMDIDHFKLYNDYYGHGAGDECLRRVARAILSQISRSADLVARYGGEEFIAVLPGTSSAGALTTSRRFKAAVEALSIPHEKSKTFPIVTLSVGTATYGENYKPAESHLLLKAADAALYQAKEGGRNRIMQFKPDSVEVQTEAPEKPFPDYTSISARVLLAEDNPGSQQLVMLILKKLGFSAHAVSNGHEALDALEREPFDIVLMDMQMPEMDGLEATRIIRKRERESSSQKSEDRRQGSSSHIPIIALTAYSVPDDKEKCLEAGVDDYLTKPVSPSLLAETMKKWLSEGRATGGRVF
ncbi:MAG: response regulator [Deltaproteobacteria bacterium]|nr:response regulator [Deltaproteobacteria bacterium]